MSDRPLREADSGHAADHAYRLIREQILAGQRAAGEWLREGELAESIGVSRTPVREALRRLTAEGLVRHERNRGVQVQAWSIHDLDEIFGLRSVLEPWGCRLAATTGAVDLDALDALAHRMDELAPGGRPTDVDELTRLQQLPGSVVHHLAGEDHRGRILQMGTAGTDPVAAQREPA